MTTKHFVTLPDGQTAQRVSQNRVYSHVVVGRRLYAVDRAEAEAAWHAPQDRKNFAYYTETAARAVRHYAFGDYTPTEAEAAKAAEHLAGVADAEAYVAQQLARRIASVEARRADGYYDAWGALTWASRLDLAEKQLGRWPGFETRVLPVSDTVEVKPRKAVR